MSYSTSEWQKMRKKMESGGKSIQENNWIALKARFGESQCLVENHYETLSFIEVWSKDELIEHLFSKFDFAFKGMYQEGGAYLIIQEGKKMPQGGKFVSFKASQEALICFKENLFNDWQLFLYQP